MNYKRLARFLPIAVTIALLGAACSDGGGDDTALVDSARTEQPADSTAPTDDELETSEESTEQSTEPADDGEDVDGGSLGSITGELMSDDAGAPVSLRLDVTVSSGTEIWSSSA